MRARPVRCAGEAVWKSAKTSPAHLTGLANGRNDDHSSPAQRPLGTRWIAAPPIWLRIVIIPHLALSALLLKTGILQCHYARRSAPILAPSAAEQHFSLFCPDPSPLPSVALRSIHIHLNVCVLPFCALHLRHRVTARYVVPSFFNRKSNLLATIAPGLLCIGAVFFLHFQSLASIVVYNAGLAAGVANAMLPLIQRSGAADQPQRPLLKAGKLDSPVSGEVNRLLA